MRVVVSFLGRVLATVVVGLAGVALTVGVIVPRIAGATTYTVLSGSMTPTLRVGELIAVRPASQITTGDVITYQVRSGASPMVTHRVVGIGSTVGGERVYRTRGDANEAADSTLVRAVQVRGKLWYHVPYLGYVSVWLTGGRRGVIAAVVAVALLCYAAWHVLQTARERGPRRANQDSTGGAT